MEDSDILLIDKPAGMTSFDVIRVLRKKLGIWKMGHAGTLDPLATGLMIIGVERGTKKLHEFLKLSKIYEAEILVGERRSTGDMEGKILEEVPVPEISKELLEVTLKGLEGKHVLPVSAYSAIKQGGVPLYKRARKAEKEGSVITELPLREMEVFEATLIPITNIASNRDTLELQGFSQHRVVVGARFHVGSGTYIRSLAEEFGRRLGYPATLKSLRRTNIGSFDIKDARKIDFFLKRKCPALNARRAMYRSRNRDSSARLLWQCSRAEKIVS